MPENSEVFMLSSNDLNEKEDHTEYPHRGGTIEYFVFHPAIYSSLPKVERIVLGRNFKKGHTAIVGVPGGC
jgi:hypothetical protein